MLKGLQTDRFLCPPLHLQESFSAILFPFDPFSQSTPRLLQPEGRSSALGINLPEFFGNQILSPLSLILKSKKGGKSDCELRISDRRLKSKKGGLIL
jgi:hypothetical protein